MRIRFTLRTLNDFIVSPLSLYVLQQVALCVKSLWHDVKSVKTIALRTT